MFGTFGIGPLPHPRDIFGCSASLTTTLMLFIYFGGLPNTRIFSEQLLEDGTIHKRSGTSIVKLYNGFANDQFWVA